jgi:N-methylhydantoinase A
MATLHTDNRNFALQRVNAILERLKRQGDAFLERAGVPRKARRFECFFQARYEYQSWEIEVGFPVGPRGLKKANLAALVQSFHDMHERIYTIKDVGEVVEFTTWKVRAIGDIGGAGRRGRERPKQRGTAKPKGKRKVYIHEKGGMTNVPVYDGATMGAGAKVPGPAVIEEETTTILLLPRQTAKTDQYGNYRVEDR